MKPLNKSDWINNPLVKRRLDEVWEVEGDYFKVCFEEVVTVLEAHHKKYGDQIENRQFITRRYKDMIGAHGIGKTFINIGLYTEDALNEENKGEEIVKDHVFGYITIANKVVADFLAGKINNKWLKDNFHLWLVINVSKEEHKKENILRSNQKNGKNIDYDKKKKLEHYKNVSQLFYLEKDYKVYNKNKVYKDKLVKERGKN